ncbi:SigE family RNA polymerase sigma factor [Glycomyces arizonensis]|uniref:SigE family RNA polymerase sigma factor n=1 Tax=Glycomyces arizonensis TaxID=256035 RepID=UPI00040DB998|nr:SigE family RNA polymerase sigma factor [Glycomyces arizonensis]
MDVPAPQGEAAFRVFFEQHHAELARFAWLLLGEKAAAEDLAADAMLAVWKQWNRVERSASGIAYARGIVANLAKTRIRSAVRERRRNAMFWLRPGESVSEPNVAAVVDVRRALARLPFRKRACVVLRHSLGLSELETAEALGVSVGTVKSQTSKGLAELRKILGPPSGGQNGSSWDSIPNGVGR